VWFPCVRWFALATIAVLCSPSPLDAQQDTTARPTRITLTDDSELIGVIVNEDSLVVRFRTAGGLAVGIPKSQIKSLEFLSGLIQEGQYYRPDPNDTRLFFSPTARPLRNGQTSFSVYQLFFPLLGVGIGNVFTLAGGISLFPFVDNQVVYLAPKITPLQTDQLSLAGGLFFVKSTAARTEGIGMLYGVASYGPRTSSLTAGVGWGFSGSDFADKPVLILGGEVQLSNSLKLITENWIIPKSEAEVVSLGFRLFGERLSADLGFIYPAGEKTTGFPFIPWVGFAYAVGSQ
jgi:hypothetical protein